jgi:hypothetical protein
LNLQFAQSEGEGLDHELADGKCLLVSTEDTVLRVWDVATQEVVR